LLWGFSTSIEQIFVAVILVLAVGFGFTMDKKAKMTISYEAD